MIGTTIRHYRILHQLGKGGMGEVYAAEDTRLKRKVALKVLPDKMARDHERLNRFQTEAEAIAALNHPNVVTIFSVEEADGIHFLTMELVEGKTLQQINFSESSDWKSFLRIAISVAEAVDAAHQKGIIHRDLKPGNIMLTEDGRVKVLDFGLAKWIEKSSGGNSTELETLAHTSEGVVLGTIPYMSPEQAMGQPLDARSDIFSLGTVLYQLISGSLPFQGATSLQILSQIIRTDPPPLKWGPSELENIIRRCLEKNPDQRYQTMINLHADLTALTNDQRVVLPSKALHNLPAPVTKFIGRENELTNLLLLLSNNRLLTITGPAGSGKSRLALEASFRNIDQYRDGIRYIDLAPVNSELVMMAIGMAVGVKESADQLLIESISDHLKSLNVLLLFDNCEHVLDEAARVSDLILRSTSKAHILATSREALNLAGETTWIVPPLSLPAERAGNNLENANRSDAVLLFVDRAVARDSRFSLTAANVDAVIGICQRLDGIPLAIELAAARVKLMSAAEIRTRLDDCFRFLNIGTRGTLSRHQTLRAAVDWSFDLLTSEEQLLFRRAAVFRNGFDLTAVENVCGNAPLDSDQVLEVLSRLIDKSLVQSERSVNDVVRYRILEPLRQYGFEKLGESGEMDAVARSHLDHYLDLSERAYEERIENETNWLDRLELDHENLRIALTWASQHDMKAALQLASALGWFWVLHSHLSEGRRWLRSVLQTDHGSTRERARALCAAGSLAVFQGDFGELEPAEQGLAIWRELGDQREVAIALDSMAWNELFKGNDAKAMGYFEEALSIHKKLGNDRLANRVTLGICQTLVSRSDVELAEPMAQKALPLALHYDDARDIHFAYHFLADCALIRGDAKTARVRYTDSLRAAVRLGDRIEISFELEGIAMALAGLGYDSKSLQLEGAVLAERERLRAVVNIPFWSELKQRYLGTCESRLGLDAAEKEKNTGRSMTFESAIEYALKLE